VIVPNFFSCKLFIRDGLLGSSFFRRLTCDFAGVFEGFIFGVNELRRSKGRGKLGQNAKADPLRG
jgi:hypothetical protein